jgi:hypothetical protein
VFFSVLRWRWRWWRCRLSLCEAQELPDAVHDLGLGRIREEEEHGAEEEKRENEARESAKYTPGDDKPGLSLWRQLNCLNVANEEDSPTLNLPIWLLDGALDKFRRFGGAKAKHHEI